MPERNGHVQAAPIMLRVRKRHAYAFFGIVLAAVGVVLAWGTGVLGGSRVAPDPIQVNVIGHNWWWEFHYPGLGIKTANELHVPVDTEIVLRLSTVDVTHTLSIPELGFAADALPGRTNTVALRVEEPGDLGGECSEVCGLAHGMMRVRVVAQTQADFDLWAVNQQAPAAAPQTERQTAGYEFVTTACATCHSLNPAEPRTDLKGPNLAHLMSRSVFAGASFTLNETNLRRWIRDTQAMKAGNDMIVNLPRDDYEAVVEYLLMLK